MSRSVFGRFAPLLQEAIATRLGWASLRPVQELAGHAILDGRNAVVLAPTAGGKTEAAMFPALSLLVEHGAEAVGAVYVSPIRALLNNQADRLGLYTEMVGLRRFVWHGDIDAGAKRRFVQEPAELLMTTPESLEVMLASTRVPVPALFGDLRIVVVDEVHALAGTDRGAHMLSVIERIADHSRHDVQRIGLSATVGNPDAIVDWLRGTSRRDGVVIDPPKAPRPRAISVVLEEDELALAAQAAKTAAGKKSLFFCDSRKTSEKIAERMRDRDIEVFVHHGSVSRGERLRAEETFHHGESAAIVCTSTLELGIDVGDLDLVFQADAPGTVSSFLQRMGRTGRREGTVANMTFFCETVDAVMLATALVELAREGWVEPIPPQTRCWAVFVHQLLAFTLETGVVTRAEAWRKLSRLPDLAGITRAEFEAVVDHMIASEYLHEADGRLSMGETAERAYGRKNFFELYAVFTSTQPYDVVTTGGADIGSLEPSFVSNFVETMSAFVLAGRAWLVQAVDQERRVVTVIAAPRGKKPDWGRFGQRALGYTVSQRIKRLLCEPSEHPYLSEAAAAAVSDRREAFAGLLGEGRPSLQSDVKGWRWWTFAGGAINRTLACAFTQLMGWKVMADSFRLRFEGDSVTEGAVRDAIATLAQPAIWDDVPFWKGVLGQLGNYRLSKFQPALPERYQIEMVGSSVLDLAGTRVFLSASAQWSAADSAALLGRVVAEIGGGDAATMPVATPMHEVRWIADLAALQALCADVATRRVIALDVETTVGELELCLVQIGVPEYSAVIDVLALPDLGPIAAVLEDERVVKLIHNAAFEREVFAAAGIELRNVVDTLELSRKRRGRRPDGHRLAAVCRRELGLRLDKTPQKSDWTARPLSEAQLQYAALDVEILLRIHAALTTSPEGAAP